jgi:hypothetical protein
VDKLPIAESAGVADAAPFGVSGGSAANAATANAIHAHRATVIATVV